MNEYNGMDGTAWGLFAATGQLGYYLLYKELSGSHDNPDGVDPRFE